LSVIIPRAMLLVFSALAALNTAFGDEPNLLYDAKTDSAYALLEELNDWMDSHCNYVRQPGDAPEILFIEIGTHVEVGDETCFINENTRGLYDPHLRRIYLVDPWSADEIFDVSVLLHELIHDRQAGHASRWDCPAAMDWPAYKLQAEWLNEQGIDPDFDWLRIFVESRCPRGPHAR